MTATFPRPKTTRIIAMCNQKGGVGKTTTTVNLAASLAEHGNTVLVVDLDPQGNASTALGIDHHAGVPSVYDVLLGSPDDKNHKLVPISEVVQKCPNHDRLFVVPATIDLAGAEIELVSAVSRENRLQRAIHQYLAGDGQDTDYVFIDCGPSLGLLTLNALAAATEVLIPMQCEYYALEGLSQLMANIELVQDALNPELKLSTVLLTMHDGRTNLADQVAEEVRAHFPKQTLATKIPRSVRVSEAPSYQQTVIQYEPSSPGALSYTEAARELATRGAS